MLVGISGSPGTGKTIVAKKLSKELNYEYILVNKLAREKGFILGKDKKRNSEVVDIEKLRGLKLEGNKVLDGHLSHFIPVDILIVLRTRPDVLKERLKKKGWDRDKIQENMEAEILGVCAFEAKEENENMYEINTTERKPNEVVGKIEKIIKGEEKSESIDWLEEYQEMLET